MTAPNPFPFDAGDFAYGTWRLLDDEVQPTPAELAARFEHCFAAGIDTIDTAEIYGLYAVEAAIGGALQANPELKEKFRFVTKAGINIPSQEKAGVEINQYHATGDNLIACAEKSLRLLGLDALDLFLVHRPDWLTPPEDTAAGLLQLLEEGKVKAIGVSNYTPSQFETLDRLVDGKLATNQIEFCPLHLAPIYDGSFDQCLQKKIRPMAWSPLGGGRIFADGDEAGTRLCAYLGKISPEYDNAPLDALVYAWILAHPTRPTVILGSNKTSRISSGVKGGQISLSREHWYGIWEAAQGCSIP